MTPRTGRTDGVDIEDLGPKHCRFVLDDKTFCGDEAVAGSYCKACAAVVYQPDKPKAVKPAWDLHNLPVHKVA